MKGLNVWHSLRDLINLWTIYVRRIYVMYGMMRHCNPNEHDNQNNAQINIKTMTALTRRDIFKLCYINTFEQI